MEGGNVYMTETPFDRAVNEIGNLQEEIADLKVDLEEKNHMIETAIKKLNGILDRRYEYQLLVDFLWDIECVVFFLEGGEVDDSPET
jgi:hypothetical protein